MVVLGLFTVVITGCDGSDGSADSIPEDYYFWDYLGTLGQGWVTPYAIAIDPSDNQPIVVFVDMANGHKAQVMKLSAGGAWTDLGIPSPHLADHPCIVIDPSDNKPIVVFQEDTTPPTAPTRVMKWSTGTTWTDLGYPSGVGAITLGSTRHPAIALDPADNKPIVVFVDANNGYRPQVKKWDSGTTWTDLGFVSVGVGRYPSIAVDATDSKPVVVFVDPDNGDKAHVKKWSSGTSWNDLGFASPGEAFNTVIAIDPVDNRPIVSYIDTTTPIPPPYIDVAQERVRVWKWLSGTTWTDLGFPGVRRSDSPAMAIDPADGYPVVAFRDWAVPPPGGGIHVTKWSSGGTWIGMGWPIEGAWGSCSLAIDPSDNKPVVVLFDSTNIGAMLHVAKHP